MGGEGGAGDEVFEVVLSGGAVDFGGDVLGEGFGVEVFGQGQGPEVGSGGGGGEGQGCTGEGFGDHEFGGVPRLTGLFGVEGDAAEPFADGADLDALAGGDAFEAAGDRGGEPVTDGFPTGGLHEQPMPLALFGEGDLAGEHDAFGARRRRPCRACPAGWGSCGGRRFSGGRIGHCPERRGRWCSRPRGWGHPSGRPKVLVARRASGWVVRQSLFVQR